MIKLINKKLILLFPFIFIHENNSKRGTLKNALIFKKFGDNYNYLYFMVRYYRIKFDSKRCYKFHEKMLEISSSGDPYFEYSISKYYFGNFEESKDLIDKALHYKKRSNLFGALKGQIYLKLGLWEKGFELYEKRFDLGAKPHSKVFGKKWTTQNLEGKTLLLITEQGIGDNIQFVRFAKTVKYKFNCSITIYCKNNMFNFFDCLDFVDKVICIGSPLYDYDYYIPMCSLPYTLNTRYSKELKQNFNLGETHYDKKKLNDEVKVNIKKIKSESFVKVGIVWRGSDLPLNRGCELSCLCESITSDNIKLYSFQFGELNEEEKNILSKYNVSHLGGCFPDIYETGFMLNELDFMFSIDTSSAHLALSFGIKTFLLLIHESDWRWGTTSDRTFWYENAVLLRQDKPGCWEAVYNEIKKLNIEKIEVTT